MWRIDPILRLSIGLALVSVTLVAGSIAQPVCTKVQSFEYPLPLIGGESSYRPLLHFDLDADGDLEILAVADEGPLKGRWFILEPDGRGGLTGTQLEGVLEDFDRYSDWFDSDLNGDGILELVTVKQEYRQPDVLSVYSADLQGFDLIDRIELSPISGAIAADLDADGKDEIIASVFGMTHRYVLSTTGELEFAGSRRGTQFDPILAFDINGNGYEDVIGISPGANGLVGVLGGVQPSLATTQVGSPSGRVLDATVEDFDDDGREEIVYLMTADRFSSRIVGVEYTSLAIVETLFESDVVFGEKIARFDLDADGRDDYVTYSGPFTVFNEEFSLLVNDPGPSVTVAGRFSVQQSFVGVMDLDGDGLNDVLLDTPSWIRNLGNGSFGVRYLSGLEYASRANGVIDWDADGRDDLVSGVLDRSTGRTNILLQRFVSDDRLETHMLGSVDVFESFEEVFVRDVDRDGVWDVLLYERGGNPDRAWFAYGIDSMQLGTFEPLPWPPSTREVQFADLDGDGHDEIITGEQGTWSVVTQTPMGWTLLEDVATNLEPALFIPFDGDDRADVVTIADGSLAFLPSAGLSSFGAPIPIAPMTDGDGYSRILMRDVDGDGDEDIAAWTDDSSGLFVRNDLGEFSLLGPAPPTDFYESFVDVDGDRIADSVTGSFAATVRRGDGEGLFPYEAGPFLNRLAVSIQGDFTGDGVLDFLRSESRSAHLFPGLAIRNPFDSEPPTAQVTLITEETTLPFQQTASESWRVGVILDDDCDARPNLESLTLSSITVAASDPTVYRPSRTEEIRVYRSEFTDQTRVVLYGPDEPSIRQRLERFIGSGAFPLVERQLLSLLELDRRGPIAEAIGDGPFAGRLPLLLKARFEGDLLVAADLYSEDAGFAFETIAIDSAARRGVAEQTFAALREQACAERSDLVCQ